MDTIKHSHQTNVNKHQVERLNLLYETYRRYIEKRPFLTVWWYFVIVIFIFLYSSLTFDAPSDPTERPSAAISHLYFQFFDLHFWFAFISVMSLIILIDRYTRFYNLPLDILSDHQLDYIKSEPTLSYYFRSALTKNMKINKSFFDNVYSYKNFLERKINKSIKFSQDEERAKKRQKAIDIAKSI
jgi:hypothetical protein